MEILTFVVLEETLEKLAQQRVSQNTRPRLEQCVTAVRACMDLIALHPTNRDYTNKIRQALSELATIERQNGEFILARRLKIIAHQLSVSGIAEKRFAQTASTS
jgi:hypothetical protein